MLVNKFYSDNFYLNSVLSSYSGIPLAELSALEREFLYLIDFDLSINAREYNEYLYGVNSFFSDDNLQHIEQLMSTL